MDKVKKNKFGFLEIKNKPTKEELKEYYENKYYQEANGSYELKYSENEIRYFNAKIEQRYSILKKYISNGKIFLDVGCGEGYALSFFKKKAWAVLGLDFTSEGVKSKNPECANSLIEGDIFQLLDHEIKNEKRYDVIWLQNVLEHVLEPVDLLISLQSLINTNGVVVLTVPNDFSDIQIEALDKKYIDEPFWVTSPDHLNYFNHDSLITTVNSTGWECLDIICDFPIDWYLFHPGSNYINNNMFGKDAHKARVDIENLIHTKPIDDVNRFWSAAAKLGIGRDITAFLRVR